MTQTVADQILSKLDSSLEQVVTSTGPVGGPHFRGHGFGFGAAHAADSGSDGSGSLPAAHRGTGRVCVTTREGVRQPTGGRPSRAGQCRHG